MTSYLGVGKLNTSSTTDVRGILGPLVKLAERKRVAIVGIMHFNKKADVTNAMLRIADSLAYVAASRPSAPRSMRFSTAGTGSWSRSTSRSRAASTTTIGRRCNKHSTPARSMAQPS